MKLAALEAAAKDAGFFELAKLKNMLDLAEKTNFSEDELIPHREAYSQLNNRLLPVSF